jgi:ADP-ribose pyrophosphatase YjhB (NUDIX family)
VTGTPLAEAGWLRFAGALLVDERGRYLLQRRDDRPDILHPGALGLFGGGLEAGESADEAIRRELAEEIGLVPGDLAPFRTVRLPVRRPGGSVMMAAIALFEGSVAADDVATLTQREGAGRVLMPPALLLLEDRVALSARIGIALHAQEALVPAAPTAEVLRWSA